LLHKPLANALSGGFWHNAHHGEATGPSQAGYQCNANWNAIVLNNPTEVEINTLTGSIVQERLNCPLYLATNVAVKGAVGDVHKLGKICLGCILKR
jgi:hypothetical protein